MLTHGSPLKKNYSRKFDPFTHSFCFVFGFTALSRIFHLHRADFLIEGGRKPEYPENIHLAPSFSLVTRARLELTAVRDLMIKSQCFKPLGYGRPQHTQSGVFQNI